MNKSKSLTNRSFSLILIAVLLFFLSVKANSQIINDVKLELNGNKLFINCIKDGSKLYIQMEELALAIDGSVKISTPYEIGPYFKFEGTKASLVKTGSGKDSRIKVNKTGILSSDVKIIIQGEEKHQYIDIESFTAALGGVWDYLQGTGVYVVYATGCSTCLINETVK